MRQVFPFNLNINVSVLTSGLYIKLFYAEQKKLDWTCGDMWSKIFSESSKYKHKNKHGKFMLSTAKKRLEALKIKEEKKDEK